MPAEDTELDFTELLSTRRDEGSQGQDEFQIRDRECDYNDSVTLSKGAMHDYWGRAWLQEPP